MVARARSKHRTGKGKGQQFERVVCKTLSRWVTDGAREDVFWRSAMSGGRATVHGQNVRQAGDITAVSVEGYAFTEAVYIECKFYKELRLRLFLLDGGGPLNVFWQETVRKANEYDRHPMLIAKDNNMTPLVITTRSGLIYDDDFPSIDIDMKNLKCRIVRLEDLTRVRYQRFALACLRPPKKVTRK